METYTMKTNKISIKLGKFKDNVYDKQVISYGIDSAEKNLKSSINILTKSLEQKNDPIKSNNVLLVGKVQSGKTSNLEMITALSFDNGFNMVIIYGGYDKELLQQCVDRFSDTFDTENDNDYVPYLFDSNQDLSFINNSFIENTIEEKRPIILCVMKRPTHLNRVNSFLSLIDTSKINAFIIDDEGDQASLNTKKNMFKDADGNPEGSPTYHAICYMKTLLNNPIYYAVTATPEANIFQPDISELMPSSVHLIQPANLYTGADVFHLNSDNLIKVIEEVNSDSIEKGILIDSLKNSIMYYLIASALMKERNINSSEMIIHAYREIEGHINLYNVVQSYLDDLADTFKNNIPADVDVYFSEMKEIYTNEYFSDDILINNPWNSHLESLIKGVVKKGIKIVMQNSEGVIDKKVLKHFKYKIYIGGDLLQRGITFKKLVCTYFTRWAKKGTMDTNLQRARWFGYRNEFIDLCKVFTTATIKSEFSNLANIENDLWSQFSMAEAGEISLNDIVIDGDETNLNPTRGNVAQYKKTKFGKLWNNQMYVTFDINQINKNNAVFESLMYSCKPIETSAGRLDGKVSAYYSMIEKSKFIDLINNTDYVFDVNPFNGKTSLIAAIDGYDEVCIEIMFGGELKDVRKRSFNGNKVSALQQGADTIDINYQKYKGDSYVIANAKVPCIQIFKILPEINGELKDEFKQYMYSIHFPVKHSVFVKE